jgi:hypothetical protein
MDRLKDVIKQIEECQPLTKYQAKQKERVLNQPLIND